VEHKTTKSKERKHQSPRPETKKRRQRRCPPTEGPPERRQTLHFNWKPGKRKLPLLWRNRRSGSKTHATSYLDRARIFNGQGNAGPLRSLGLTRRETEVLSWITQGKTNYEIGVILGAGTRTICKHVQRILNKLQVENRTAAAAIAIRTLANARK